MYVLLLNGFRKMLSSLYLKLLRQLYFMIVPYYVLGGILNFKGKCMALFQYIFFVNYRRAWVFNLCQNHYFKFILDNSCSRMKCNALPNYWEHNAWQYLIFFYNLLFFLFCYSLEECGRYLETIKVYENKPADIIQGQMDTDYLSRVLIFLWSLVHQKNCSYCA